MGEAAAAGEVGEVVAVGVSLALERNRAVCLVPVAVSEYKKVKPFENVGYVEWNPEQLAHLRVVDALVVYYVAVYPCSVAHPVCAEKIQAYSRRHQRRLYDSVPAHIFVTEMIKDILFRKEDG